MEGVVLSILQTVLGSKDAVPDASLPEGSLQAFLEASSFTEEVEGEAEPSMTLEDFRKWCASVPSIKKFLTTLLKGPVAGLCSVYLPFVSSSLYFKCLKEHIYMGPFSGVHILEGFLAHILLNFVLYQDCRGDKFQSL